MAKWDGTNTAVSVTAIGLTQPAVTGKQYGAITGIASYTSGAQFMGFFSPVTPTDGAGFVDFGHYSRQVTATGDYANARVYVNAGAVLDTDYMRVYDITALLEKKWRIVFVYSQSNWVGPGDAADRLANDPPEARAVTIPSSANNVRGSFLDAEGIGVPMLMCDPVQHLSGNVGGGPAGAFARTFCDGLRDDEVLVYVAAGYSGGGRLVAGDVWNRESDGVAWLNLLKQVDAMVARAPAGSSVAGCLFCQGEADLAENVGDLHTETIRSDFELLRARWGNFPIVVSEIGWEDTLRADVANMIASHAKLDSNSGDALSLPLCRYVPRPAGSTFLADTLHYDQPTQRVRGASAATALLELQYGGAQPAPFTMTAGSGDGVTGYSDGSLSAAFGAISDQPVEGQLVSLIATDGVGPLTMYVSGNVVDVLTGCTLIIDGQSFPSTSVSYSEGLGTSVAFADDGFLFVDAVEYACALVLL